MANKGRFQQAKAPVRAWKVILIVILCIVLLVGAVAAAGWFYLSSKLEKITQAKIVEQDVTGLDLSALIGNLDETDPYFADWETEPTTAPTEAPTEEKKPDYGESGRVVNILVIGQDSREGEDSKLADSIMLLTLNKETRTLSMTSFLRDSYVKLPANYRGHTCGWNRINTSYALGYSWYGSGGAMEMLDLTLEGNYGVEVDGNVEVCFDTVINVVDAIGGVEVNLVGDEFTVMRFWQDVYNEYYEWWDMDKSIDIHEGMNVLNGEMALEYARQRHMNDADNDMNRAGRQRIIVEAIIKRLTELSPMELDAVVDLVCSEIITDISVDDMKMYVRELLPYIFDLNTVSYQCPTEGSYWGEMVQLPDGEGGVLKIDFNRNRKMLEAIQIGDVPEL